MNALAFSGTNFVFSRLKNYDAEECKSLDLALEKLQRTRDKWNKDRMKRLKFTTKRLPEKIKQGHISAMLMEQCLIIIEYQ